MRVVLSLYLMLLKGERTLKTYENGEYKLLKKNLVE